MTEEELEQKAEEWFAKLKEKKIPFSISNTNYCIKQAHKDGYKQAITEKNSAVEELKAQIEKMKCCGNCKNCIIEGVLYCVIKKRDVGNRPCDEWELAE